MFIKDDFIINIDFYRINEINSISPTKSNIISSSTQNQEDEVTNSVTWYTMICLQGSPIDSNLDYIAADITITSKWTGDEYKLLYTNNKQLPPSMSLQSSTYSDYQGADEITTQFAIGTVKVKYWQACDIACNDKFGPCWNDNQYQLLQQKFPLYVFYILLVIFIIFLIMLGVAHVNHKYYYKC